MRYRRINRAGSINQWLLDFIYAIRSTAYWIRHHCLMPPFTHLRNKGEANYGTETHGRMARCDCSAGYRKRRWRMIQRRAVDAEQMDQSRQRQGSVRRRFEPAQESDAPALKPGTREERTS
jgi:hypothetical protein